MKIILLLALAIGMFTVNANNLRIEGLRAEGQNEIKFRVAWDNSWRAEVAPNNHDAVWFFVKIKGANGWEHLNLPTSAIDFECSNNTLEIQPATDEKGVMIQRRGTGEGNIEWSTIRISNIQNLAPNAELQLFGIEMVYIPAGDFWVGDGASIGSFCEARKKTPFKVTDATINLGNLDGYLWNLNNNTMYLTMQAYGELPVAFPRGTKSMYCMKYEISQQQWVDFLNSLTPTQQAKHVNPYSPQLAGSHAYLNEYQNTLLSTENNISTTDSLTWRNSIVLIKATTSTTPALYGCNADKANITNQTTDGQCRAVNFLNWADLGAYLDWACLRPMTEMEYEKICRGANNYPIKGEIAFGDTLIQHPTLLNDVGTEIETYANELKMSFGVSNNQAIFAQEKYYSRGPLRCGFAAKADGSRRSSGAGWYGTMEMSGNVWEIVVSLNNNEGKAFTGQCGDGMLDDDAYHNTIGWPEYTEAKGTSYKGGSWNSACFGAGKFCDIAISDRFYSIINAKSRKETTGGRGVR